jgi:predicted transcriptional regulator
MRVEIEQTGNETRITITITHKPVCDELSIPLRKPFNEMLKYYMELLCITQAELADKMCVTRSFISQYVLGKRRSVSKKTMAKFADGLGITLDELIGGQ